MKELENEGSQLTLELTCVNGCSYRWQSQPTVSGTKGAGNLLLAASVFFSGIHFAKFELTVLCGESKSCRLQSDKLHPGSSSNVMEIRGFKEALKSIEENEAQKALVRTVKDKRLLKDLDHLTKCIHTTTLEVYHSMYLKYLPKRIHFGYDVMVHASMLAALDHNNNTNREQVSVILTQLSFLSTIAQLVM
ncbi:hypothetical protein DPX16_23409 [Anabarilius grahami]|uniref:Uncharacterized protein n=1 Tax=Anabarilius grahami TaxID=495550 RepID=A0A3N0Y164_ANAGA|nr:hypothetical protein DPX16_23409 [Anabarilius grahami]